MNEDRVWILFHHLNYDPGVIVGIYTSEGRATRELQSLAARMKYTNYNEHFEAYSKDAGNSCYLMEYVANVECKEN